jgi:uncharacterized protein (DUF433 family)
MTLPDFMAQDSLGEITVRGHRIGLEHLIYFYNEGYSPEMLLDEYPALSLPLIHKVIAFYLENRNEVDAYLAACQGEIERQRAAAPRAPTIAELRRRLELKRHAEGA